MASRVDAEKPGKKSAIEGRGKQIRAQIEETTSNYDREKLQELLKTFDLLDMKYANNANNSSSVLH